MLFRSQKIKQHKIAGVLIICYFFDDFIGRLSLETKPRSKSWPTLSIV